MRDGAHSHWFPLAPLGLTARHMSWVLPQTDRALDGWRTRARAIPDPTLRRQALSSIDTKRFHCQGGTVFAAWHPQSAEALLRFIVAFQTVSDYLDNLCDRTDHLDAFTFRTLHRSMMDAVSPFTSARGGYYSHYPHKEDGGYLEALVDVCRTTLAQFPRYSQFEVKVKHLVSLYIDLQVYKHVEYNERVPNLEAWFGRHQSATPQLYWWEFAAAAGSTLGIFALVTEGARHEPVEALESLFGAYFPWIAALHILLDYLIDQEEDRRERDLNFVSFYTSRQEARERLVWILEEAVRSARGLAAAPFHLCVIEGLLGLYLTDPKVVTDGHEDVADALISRAGWRARLVRSACRVWRCTRSLKAAD